MLERLDTVGLWGVTVTLGYLLTGFTGSLGLQGETVNYGLITMWLVLMAIPAYSSLKKYRKDGNWKNLNVIWSVAMIIGVLANYSGQLAVSGDILRYTYYQKWFVLPGILFAYTAWKINGFSRKVYAAATVLNLGIGLSLSTIPVFQTYAFYIAALIQGVPMLVDWYRFNIME